MIDGSRTGGRGRQAGEAIPADSPIAPSYVIPDDGPAYSVDPSPDGGDEDQQGLRDDLAAKAQDLIGLIGNSNELAPLRQAAEHYQRQIGEPLDQISLKRLWSAGNALRQRREAHHGAVAEGRVTAQLPPEIAPALDDLTATHALFWMGFPEGVVIEDEIRKGLGQPRSPDLVRAAGTFAGKLDGRGDVLVPDDQAAFADDATAALGTGPSAELAELSLRARTRNLFAAAGRKVYRALKSGSKQALDAVKKHDFIAWLMGEPTTVGLLLSALGDGAHAILEVLKVLLK